MTPDIFIDLVRQGYNRIPVVKTLLTDFDTGLGLYHKIAQGPYYLPATEEKLLYEKKAKRDQAPITAQKE